MLPADDIRRPICFDIDMSTSPLADRLLPRIEPVVATIAIAIAATLGPDELTYGPRNGRPKSMLRRRPKRLMPYVDTSADVSNVECGNGIPVNSGGSSGGSCDSDGCGEIAVPRRDEAGGEWRWNCAFSALKIDDVATVPELARPQKRRASPASVAASPSRRSMSTTSASGCCSSSWGHSWSNSSTWLDNGWESKFVCRHAGFVRFRHSMEG